MFMMLKILAFIIAECLAIYGITYIVAGIFKRSLPSFREYAGFIGSFGGAISLLNLLLTPFKALVTVKDAVDTVQQATTAATNTSNFFSSDMFTLLTIFGCGLVGFMIAYLLFSQKSPVHLAN